MDKDPPEYDAKDYLFVQARVLLQEITCYVCRYAQGLRLSRDSEVPLLPIGHLGCIYPL